MPPARREDMSHEQKEKNRVIGCVGIAETSLVDCTSCILADYPRCFLLFHLSVSGL